MKIKSEPRKSPILTIILSNHWGKIYNKNMHYKANQ